MCTLHQVFILTLDYNTTVNCFAILTISSYRHSALTHRLPCLLAHTSDRNAQLPCRRALLSMQCRCAHSRYASMNHTGLCTAAIVSIGSLLMRFGKRRVPFVNFLPYRIPLFYCRLQNPRDPSSGYPIAIQRTPTSRPLCRICSKLPATLSIINDVRFG